MIDYQQLYEITKKKSLLLYIPGNILFYNTLILLSFFTFYIIYIFFSIRDNSKKTRKTVNSLIINKKNRKKTVKKP